MDGRLLIVHGRPEQVIPRLAAEIGADSVHVSADYGPYGRARDERVEKALQAKDIELAATGSAYAVAPGRVRKPDGSPYAVFTPYFRGWSSHGWRKPAGSGGRVSWLDPSSVGGKPYALQRLTSAIPKDLVLPDPGERAATTLGAEFLGQDRDGL